MLAAPPSEVERELKEQHDTRTDVLREKIGRVIRPEGNKAVVFGSEITTDDYLEARRRFGDDHERINRELERISRQRLRDIRDAVQIEARPVSVADYEVIRQVAKSQQDSLSMLNELYKS